jgi:hypothetical protein
LKGVPDWVIPLAGDIAGTSSIEDCVEAIMFDVELSGDEYARKKWTAIQQSRK